MDDDLANRFTYHPPKPDQPQRYEALRAAAGDVAQLFRNLCPPSAELERAIDHVDEAVMCANAAIARHE